MRVHLELGSDPELQTILKTELRKAVREIVRQEVSTIIEEVLEAKVKQLSTTTWGEAMQHRVNERVLKVTQYQVEREVSAKVKEIMALEDFGVKVREVLDSTMDHYEMRVDLRRKLKQ